ncbi:MAG TPA: sulfatase-like hydrolase/transferase [Chitinophagaceae bacterium]|nr:sulfatase-like hydrolase/transferase [Chitinophagaceae bacterium]
MNNLLRLILSIAIFTTTACIAQKVKTKNPNIIIIYADDLGYGDLSSYGSLIPTPNIDRIGKEGIRFTDFYDAAPVCTPSRFSLLTGSYPQRSLHGLTQVVMPGSTSYLDESETTIAEYLKTADYTTAIIGKWHLGLKDKNSSPTDYGFDMFYGFKGGAIDYYYHAYAKETTDWYVNNKLTIEKGYSTDLLTKHAIAFIDKAKNKSNPFFLYLPYNAPHYGKTDTDSATEGHTIAVSEAKASGPTVINSLQAPKAYVERFSHITNKYRQVYAAMVSNLDDNIGKLLNKLEKDGLLGTTMIWFISDNGGYSQTQQKHASNGVLRGEKASLYDGGIRVPAMVLWKGRIKSNQIISTPVCNADLLPTICSILKIKNSIASLVVDGKDISNLIFKNIGSPRDLYWRYNKQFAIRSGKWKLVNGIELYDLEKDISEKINLASKYPAVVKTLQQKFKAIDSKVNPVGGNK